jgi:aminoglycoside phosphotransferase (APT) family kinase protein
VFPTLTQDIAADALSRAGIDVAAADVDLQAREERWIAFLPADRIAWFAGTAEGRRKMSIERRVLRLLDSRCTFGVPRILFEAEDGAVEVRSAVSGLIDPVAVYMAVIESADVAESLGSAIGQLLAQQHSRIKASDAADWLPPVPSWPRSKGWVQERLIEVVEDVELRSQADDVMSKYEAQTVCKCERALVHTDLGFHNMAIDPETFAVKAVFDYDEAAWADRHHDFRYLVFHGDREVLLQAALSQYEPVAGRIDRARVFLYNAACALTFLAYRRGKGPEEQSCGRTLAEDLQWSRQAVDRALDPRRA